jgi:hypothetical protein
LILSFIDAPAENLRLPFFQSHDVRWPQSGSTPPGLRLEYGVNQAARSLQ